MIDAKIIREVAVLPIAAALLGLAYNASSPLGVRWQGGKAPVPSVEVGGESAATIRPPSPAELPDPALQNETLSAVIVSGGGDGVPVEAAPKVQGELKWADVKALLARHEVVLVDGRDTLAYEAGHIPGAISLPLPQVSDKIGELTMRYPKTTPLVIYCAGTDCSITHQEAVLLAAQYGFTQIREMPGGYAEWLAAEGQGAAAAGAQP